MVRWMMRVRTTDIRFHSRLCYSTRLCYFAICYYAILKLLCSTCMHTTPFHFYCHCHLKYTSEAFQYLAMLLLLETSMTQGVSITTSPVDFTSSINMHVHTNTACSSLLTLQYSPELTSLGICTGCPHKCYIQPCLEQYSLRRVVSKNSIRMTQERPKREDGKSQENKTSQDLALNLQRLHLTLEQSR